MKKLLNTALLLFAVLMTSCTAPNAWELVSKDSNVRFALENKQENGSTMLSYSVFYKDGVAMEKSLLGLVMDNCEYGKDAQFVSASAVKDISLLPAYPYNKRNSKDLLHLYPFCLPGRNGYYCPWTPTPMYREPYKRPLIPPTATLLLSIVFSWYSSLIINYS